MEELVNQLLKRCQVAEQLELESSCPPISCKELIPILVEFLSIKKKYDDLLAKQSCDSRCTGCSIYNLSDEELSSIQLRGCSTCVRNNHQYPLWEPSGTVFCMFYGQEIMETTGCDYHLPFPTNRYYLVNK